MIFSMIRKKKKMSKGHRQLVYKKEDERTKNVRRNTDPFLIIKKVKIKGDFHPPLLYFASTKLFEHH